jgi:stringent starvation protein B
MENNQTQQGEGIAICFTQGHGEKLIIEQVQHEGMVDMLFRSGYRLGKIETRVSWQKLSPYQVLVIGSPGDFLYDEIEIKSIVEFVREGGSLLVIADQGADAPARSNMNDITSNFGFVFQPNLITDEKLFVEKPDYVLVTTFEKHFLTRDVNQLVIATGCSMEITSDDVLAVARLSPSALKRSFVDGEWDGEESAAGEPIVVATRLGKGKVVGIGNFSVFTSLSKTYGLFAPDNYALVGNIFAWLANKKSDGLDKETTVLINVALDADSYFWMERELKNHARFANVSEIVNFAIKAVKQSFDAIEGPGEAMPEESAPLPETMSGEPDTSIGENETPEPSPSEANAEADESEFHEPDVASDENHAGIDDSEAKEPDQCDDSQDSCDTEPPEP